MSQPNLDPNSQTGDNYYPPNQHINPTSYPQGSGNLPPTPQYPAGSYSPYPQPLPAYPKPPIIPTGQPVKAKFNLKDFLKKRWWLVAIVSIVLVSILALAAVAFIASNDTPVETTIYNNVTASITSPNELPQGTPGQWEIVIENKDPVAVENVVLKLSFDSDFKYLDTVSPSPQDPEGTTYLITRLDAIGGRTPSAKVVISGILIGNPDVETEMSGQISYLPSGASNTVTKNITAVKTKITSPQLDVTIQPSQDFVTNGGEVEYTVVIKNKVDTIFRDLRIQMIYPSGRDVFTYTSSEFATSNRTAPETTPAEGTDIWKISALNGNGEATLKVRGKAFGTNDARLTFGVKIGLKDNNERYQTIVERYRDVRVVARALFVDTKIRGKDNNPIFRPGETLSIEVSYENQSQQTLTEVELESFIDDGAGVLDLTTLSFGSGQRGDVIQGQIQYKATRIPQLQVVRPGQKGTLTYSVRVKPLESFIQPNLNQISYTLKPLVKAKAQNLEPIDFAGSTYKAKGNLEFEQTEKAVKVGTNPTTGNDIFEITFTLKTWQNEVSDVKLEALNPLPTGTWTGQAQPADQLANLAYNQSNGGISWTVGVVPSYAGRGVDPIQVTFRIENTSDKTGTETLIKNIKISGLDIITGERYELTGKDVTNRR
jgi:hypothetical protein